MVSVPSEAILAQISQLLDGFEAWREYSNDGSSVDHEVETQHIRLRLYAAVQKIAPRDSVYWNDAIEVSGNYYDESAYQTLRFGAIVQALRDDIEAGWLSTVEELVHADTFSNFLDMSQELLEKGYRDAAAVIAGAVLEAHLRSLCSKHSLPTMRDDGSNLKAEALNSDLRKANVYASHQQKLVAAWQDLRNRAAHGEYGEYDDTDVRHQLMGIRNLLLAYPA